MTRGTIDVNDICFTDECYVGTGPSPNRQDDGYWRPAGDPDPEQHLKQREFQGDRIHIFVAIRPKAGIIGPIFVDELDGLEDTTQTTLTAKRFCYMLCTIVISGLRRRLGDDFTVEELRNCGARTNYCAAGTLFCTSRTISCASRTNECTGLHLSMRMSKH